MHNDYRQFIFFLNSVEPQKDKEYLGTVKKMCLNADYAAVMFDNRVQLHLVSWICICATFLYLRN
jgi:hypothetical protein